MRERSTSWSQPRAAGGLTGGGAVELRRRAMTHRRKWRGKAGKREDLYLEAVAVAERAGVGEEEVKLEVMATDLGRGRCFVWLVTSSLAVGHPSR